MPECNIVQVPPSLRNSLKLMHGSNSKNYLLQCELIVFYQTLV